MAYGPWGNEATASASFSGTWITDPTDPDNTYIQLRYGGLGRQNSRDRAKTALQFVGRNYPVYDVGDARAESVNIEATLLAEDGDAAQQKALLEELIGDGRVVLYRDGRGRKMYAMGTDYQAEDLEQGSYKVTFLLNRVDFDEQLPLPDEVVVNPASNQPQNVVATVDNYSGMVLLDWNAVTDAQSYRLFLNDIEVGSTTQDVTTYGPLESGDYSMTVVSTVGGIDSIPSAPVYFNVLRPTATIPGGDTGGGTGGGTPVGLTPLQMFRAHPNSSVNSVVLDWVDVPGATEYQVFESRSPNGVTNGLTTATTMTRGVPNALGDGPFDYWIRAKVNGVWSEESNHQRWTFPWDGTMPIDGTPADPSAGGSGGGTGGTTTAQTRGIFGVATPAGAILATANTTAPMTITTGGTAAAPRVYDGKGFTVGQITINARYVKVQNYKIVSGQQYGVLINADDVWVQNNEIGGLKPTGDGDLNIITLFGSRVVIRGNVTPAGGPIAAGVDPGGSHTDAIQTWVSSSHPNPASDIQVLDNSFVGPANPSRSASTPSIHQILMVESAGHGGNSGGSGIPSRWTVIGNTFGDSWNQAVKLDLGTSFVFSKNSFTGSSDKVFDVGYSGTTYTIHNDNTFGTGYGSVGATITATAGPALPAGDPGPGSTTGGTGGTTGGGTTPVTPDPVDVLGIRNGDPGYLHYNLGCGFVNPSGTIGSAYHKDYTVQTLEDWTPATATELKNNYYTVKDAAGKWAVAMTVEPNADKTSANTSYPRCEHREMDQTDTNNANKANWSPDANDHDWGGFSRIMTLPPAKPGVCINQCHDQQDDTVMIRSEAISGSIALVLNVYGTRVMILNSNYTLGREIYSRIRINNKTLTVYYSESTSTTTSATRTTTITYTHPTALTPSNPPWYHKFGCYAQSNSTTDTSGTKCLVYVRDWTQWHTGWPAPVTGNYAGPG